MLACLIHNLAAQQRLHNVLRVQHACSAGQFKSNTVPDAARSDPSDEARLDGDDTDDIVVTKWRWPSQCGFCSAISRVC